MPMSIYNIKYLLDLYQIGLSLQLISALAYQLPRESVQRPDDRFL